MREVPCVLLEYFNKMLDIPGVALSTQAGYVCNVRKDWCLWCNVTKHIYSEKIDKHYKY